MGLNLEAELAADQKHQHAPCSVCTFLRSQKVSERADWAIAFGDARWSTSSLLRALKRRGFTGGDSPVTNHRKAGHQP